MSARDEANFYARRWAAILGFCAGLALAASSLTAECWVVALVSTIAINTADGQPLSGAWS